MKIIKLTKSSDTVRLSMYFYGWKPGWVYTTASNQFQYRPAIANSIFYTKNQMKLFHCASSLCHSFGKSYRKSCESSEQKRLRRTGSIDGISISCNRSLMNLMWSSFCNNKNDRKLTVTHQRKRSVVQLYRKFHAIKFDVAGKERKINAPSCITYSVAELTAIIFVISSLRLV